MNDVNKKLKIQQLEELYRQDYRSHINDYFIPESNQGSFFEKYRRTVQSEEKNSGFTKSTIWRWKNPARNGCGKGFCYIKKNLR